MLNTFFCAALRAVGCLAAGVVLASASSLSGSVADADSGKPLPGALVTVGTAVTRTDANGRFHMEAAGPVVSARAYGYGRAQMGVDSQNAGGLRIKLTAITPRAVYLSFWGVGTASVREPVLKLAEQGLINAVVIDVKGDLGFVSFPTAVPAATAIGAQKTTTIPDVHGLLERLHKQRIMRLRAL